GESDVAEDEDDEPVPDDPADTFATFVHETGIAPPPNLTNVCRHLETGWELRDQPNVGLFHYSDMLADLPAEMLRRAGLLDIPLTAAHAEELAQLAGIDVMRSEASTRVPGAEAGYWHDPVAFLRSGAPDEWRAVARPADVVAYDDLVAQLV